MGDDREFNPIINQTLPWWPIGGSGSAHESTDRSPRRPRVYIISQTRLFREGLMAMMVRDGRIEVVGHGPSSQAVAEIGNLTPDLALLDMSGDDCLVIPRQLHAVLPPLRIVAVAVAELETDIIACAEAGVCGYVAQSGTVEELVATLVRALTGELVCSPRIAARLFDRLATLSAGQLPSAAADSPLTRREREIAGLVARGLQNKEIARRLCLGHATVKNHVHNILQKLNIQRRTDILGRRFDIEPWLGRGPTAPTARSSDTL